MWDNRLCMGFASAPFIFSKWSDMHIRCARREGVSYIVNYLNDICIPAASPDESKKCQLILIVALLQRLGFSSS